MANYTIEISSSSIYEPETGQVFYSTSMSAPSPSGYLQIGDTLTLTYTQGSGGLPYVTVQDLNSSIWNISGSVVINDGESVTLTAIGSGTDLIVANFPGAQYPDRNRSVTVDQQADSESTISFTSGNVAYNGSNFYGFSAGPTLGYGSTANNRIYAKDGTPVAINTVRWTNGGQDLYIRLNHRSIPAGITNKTILINTIKQFFDSVSIFRSGGSTVTFTVDTSIENNFGSFSGTLFFRWTRTSPMLDVNGATYNATFNGSGSAAFAGNDWTLYAGAEYDNGFSSGDWYFRNDTTSTVYSDNFLPPLTIYDRLRIYHRNLQGAKDMYLSKTFANSGTQYLFNTSGYNYIRPFNEYTGVDLSTGSGGPVTSTSLFLDEGEYTNYYATVIDGSPFNINFIFKRNSTLFNQTIALNIVQQATTVNVSGPSSTREDLNGITFTTVITGGSGKYFNWDIRRISGTSESGGEIFTGTFGSLSNTGGDVYISFNDNNFAEINLAGEVFAFDVYEYSSPTTPTGSPTGTPVATHIFTLYDDDVNVTFPSEVSIGEFSGNTHTLNLTVGVGSAQQYRVTYSGGSQTLGYLSQTSHSLTINDAPTTGSKTYNIQAFNGQSYIPAGSYTVTREGGSSSGTYGLEIYDAAGNTTLSVTDTVGFIAGSTTYTLVSGSGESGSSTITLNGVKPGDVIMPVVTPNSPHSLKCTITAVNTVLVEWTRLGSGTETYTLVGITRGD